MALIPCYECEKEISDKAPACPHCGAGFGQSALYSYLYDDDALADAGASALKEAIIGGETGAVADVLMSMAGVSRRGIPRHQPQKVTDFIEKEVTRAWVDMKELDKKSFTDRVTSTDPNDQAFIEGVVDGSILASAQDASEAVQDAIRADPDSTLQVRDQELYAEVKRITSVFREMEVMKVGVQAIRSGNIASHVSPPAAAKAPHVAGGPDPRADQSGTPPASEFDSETLMGDISNMISAWGQELRRATGEIHLLQEGIETVVRWVPEDELTADGARMVGRVLVVSTIPPDWLGLGQASPLLSVLINKGVTSGTLTQDSGLRSVINRGAALGALTRDSDTDAVRVVSRFTVYKDDDDGLRIGALLLAMSALTQVHTFSHTMADLTEVDPGEYHVVSQAAAPAKPEDVFAATARILTDAGLLANASRDGLTVEFPWDAGAYSALERLGGQGGGRTALLTMTVAATNPALGPGLLATLTLPLNPEVEEAYGIADSLNHLEIEAKDAPPLFGAWCTSPSRHDVVFACFVPQALLRLQTTSALAGWMAARTQQARVWIESLPQKSGPGRVEPHELYYENGQLEWKGTFVAGKIDGPFESYHENGQLQQKSTYVDGELDGPFEVYHENGQLAYKGTHVADERDGPYEVYHENGQLWDKGTFNMGQRCGEWIEDGEPVTYDPCPPGN